MIAYNTSSLDALDIAEHADRWQAGGVISSEQRDAIRAAYPVPFYSPNVFVRIALFLFTMLGASAVDGLVVLVFGSTGPGTLAILSMLYGGVLVAMLELSIESKNVYAAGVDDGLLYAGLGHIVGGVFLLIYRNAAVPPGVAVALAIVIPVALFGVARYADGVATVCLFLCVVLFPVALDIDGHLQFTQWLPWILMAEGAVVYAVVSRMQTRRSLRHWNDCLVIGEVLSLMTIAIAGNYWFARTLHSVSGNEMTPFVDGIFWFLTASIPMAFILLGWLRRDHMLLSVGLGAVALSLVTVHKFYSIMPADAALTLGGLALLALYVITSAALKRSKNGMTAKPILEPGDQGFTVLSTALAVTVQSTPHTEPPKPFEGQGGEFGGGGGTEGW